MTKSKTMRFAAILAALSIIEVNTHLFVGLIGKDNVGIITLVISVIVAVLRVMTSAPLGERQ